MIITNNSTNKQCCLNRLLNSDAGDSDSDDPQVYESMCNIQAQAGSSETSDQGNGNKTSPSLYFSTAVRGHIPSYHSNVVL